MAACASPPRPRLVDADYPGELRAVSDLSIDVLWRQRVSAQWGDGERRGFDAVVQKRGDELTVLGLSPVGVGFAIELHDGEVSLQNNTSEPLPFPPRFILLDVQRAFYPWLAGEGAGERSAEVDGELVSERWEGGRLLERRFRRVDGEPSGEIVVRHTWADPRWAAPGRTVVDNHWFGYRLVIETREETRLEPSR